ncbi:Peroxiredoxin [Prosthecobacter debontii]|uniref:Peroxiredoxin n=1 Tax=Prosthecobacter debontii TaxID=48467 RepID=A0A1T4YRC2_9BACT|nr:redoxin domain-containing protein [Prosthecobacter debontii]SKB03791.1 Peroxiredoxin [Prosthecobacter debontii]
MPRFVLLFFILLGTSLHAQSVTEQIRSVIETYETKVRANTQKIIDAKTEEEKAKYRGTIPSVGPYATQVLQIVEKNASEPGSATGVSWLITQAAAFPEYDAALKLLGTTYAQSSGIAPAVKALEYQPLEKVEPILKTIRETNPHAEEKAAALYALGMQHFRRFDAALTPEQAEASKTQAMDCFQEIVSSYSQVSIQGFPIADQAGRMLFEMSNLSVGSEVPEIDGKDVDGTGFKLSDFRGKHVVLMFWGGWCHACHGVIPSVNQFVLETQGKSVVVLGINTDIPDEARKAYQDYHVTFRNWSDGTTSGPITTLFNLRNFPTFYLVDPEGKIVLKQTSIEAIREKLSPL